MVSCDCCLISLWYERYKEKDQVGKWNVFVLHPLTKRTTRFCLVGKTYGRLLGIYNQVTLKLKWFFKRFKADKKLLWYVHEWKFCDISLKYVGFNERAITYYWLGMVLPKKKNWNIDEILPKKNRGYVI